MSSNYYHTKPLILCNMLKNVTLIYFKVDKNLSILTVDDVQCICYLISNFCCTYNAFSNFYIFKPLNKRLKNKFFFFLSNKGGVQVN